MLNNIWYKTEEVLLKCVLGQPWTQPPLKNKIRKKWNTEPNPNHAPSSKKDQIVIVKFMKNKNRIVQCTVNTRYNHTNPSIGAFIRHFPGKLERIRRITLIYPNGYKRNWKKEQQRGKGLLTFLCVLLTELWFQCEDVVICVKLTSY